MGRYNLFVDFYEPFCDPEQLETLKRIEKYSREQQKLIEAKKIVKQFKFIHLLPSYKINLLLFSIISMVSLTVIFEVSNIFCLL